MKTLLTSLSILLSIVTIAQPSVSASTAPSADATVFLPRSSVTLTGSAIQANPGHPVLDTTWTQTTGPNAATITNPSNRMNTTVTGLVAGTYTFKLTATDKKNAASTVLTVMVLPGTLPITLSSFNATHNNTGILLTWQTNTESNNSFFVVQKSDDGSNFTDLATIASQAANGNSNSPLTYSYQIFGQVVKAGMDNLFLFMIFLVTIGSITKLKSIFKGLILTAACLFFFSCSKSVTAPENTIPGHTEYRLKIVDRDGHVTYSQIKVPF